MGRYEAVLLDRDGVINDNPEGWILHREEFVLLPGVIEALAMLTRHGIRLAVVTNQRCIGRGWVSAEVVEAMHAELISRAAEAGAQIDGIYVCPHIAPCDCRKPLPGNLLRAARDLGCEPADCCMVGDRFTDVAAARNAGMDGYLIRTGHPFDPDEALSPPVCAAGVFATLTDFAAALVAARRTEA